MYFASAQEMEKLDDLAVANGLEIRQMMELAGFHMLTLFKKLDIDSNRKIVIVCGRGNKGGDGLSAARHLFNYGYRVEVILVDKAIKPDPQHHLSLLSKMSIKIYDYSHEANKVKTSLAGADIIIDSLLGYHLDGTPRDAFAELINLINSTKAKVIAYDLPSGVDASTGQCFDPCIVADFTMTLALPKKVFATKSGQAKAGQVYLVDIGIPDFLYRQIKPGIRPNFGQSLVPLK